MQTKQYKMAGIALSAMMLGVFAQAQQQQQEEKPQGARFQQGDVTFSVSGSGTSDRNFNANVAAVEMGLGLFITDHVALTARQGVSFADPLGNSNWNASTRLGVDLFMNLGPIKPFVGASLGYIYGDT